MSAMKKFLIGLMQVALLFAVVSCEKGLESESDFIGNGGGQGTDQENPFWDWSDQYPGPVHGSVETVPAIKTKVKGQYKPLAYSPEVPVIQSTGAYAGIDNIVTVIVPDGVTQLKWQIGLGHRLAPNQAQRRYENVVSKGSLNPGENQIYSNFGGYVYLYYEPEDVDAVPAEIEVTISGAYESLDYIYGSDRDTQAEYVQTMIDRAEKLANLDTDDSELGFLYWTELRSDKVILTLSVKDMIYLTSPERLLDTYHKIIDAFFEFGGYNITPEKYFPQPPMRVYADVQIPNPFQKALENNQDEHRYGHYPIPVLKSMNVRKGKDDIRDEPRYMNFDKNLEFDYLNNTGWAALHYSMGMMMFGEWAQAAWMKFPLLQVANSFYCQQLEPGWDGHWGSQRFIDQRLQRLYLWIFENRWGSGNLSGYKRSKFHNSHDNYAEWYRINSYPSGDGTPYNDLKVVEGRRMTMLFQLVQKYGWGILKYVNYRCREIGFVNEYEQDAHDFFVMACCEYTNTDLRPFFEWWHFPYSIAATQFIRQMEAEGKMNKLEPEIVGAPAPFRTVLFTGEKIEDGTVDYYFYDRPNAADRFGSENEEGIYFKVNSKGVCAPLINEDHHTMFPTQKISEWPDKLYYQDVKRGSWVGWGELINSNSFTHGKDLEGVWKNAKHPVHDPDYLRATDPTNPGWETLRGRGWLASTYLNLNTQDQSNAAHKLFDGDWNNYGGFSKLKVGGTGQGSWNYAGDTMIGWTIIDVEFKKPVKFNAIKTRQDADNGKPTQYLYNFQYYVEPPTEMDPSDDDYVEGGFHEYGKINGVYYYGLKEDGTNDDPRAVVWNGPDDPRANSIAYPGRTKPGFRHTTTTPMGFVEGGYFAHVYPGSNPQLTGDWYYGVKWLVRDPGSRSYIYYLEETIETRRFRFWLQPGVYHRLNDKMFDESPPENSYQARLREVGFGLMDVDNPPGYTPEPHSWYTSWPRDYGDNNGL